MERSPRDPHGQRAQMERLPRRDPDGSHSSGQRDHGRQVVVTCWGCDPMPVHQMGEAEGEQEQQQVPPLACETIGNRGKVALLDPALSCDQ